MAVITFGNVCFQDKNLCYAKVCVIAQSENDGGSLKLGYFYDN